MIKAGGDFMFESWVSELKNESLKEKLTEIFAMIERDYPFLKPEIKWNQPMLTDHGTYIIGFSVSKNHISIAPEQKAMMDFHDAIKEAGYSQTANLFRITASQKPDLKLISDLIEFNIEYKKDCNRFWADPPGSRSGKQL